MTNNNDTIRIIYQKVIQNNRITATEALHLYDKASLGQLADMAEHVSRKYNDNKIYYIKNIHIEPTNICRNKCKFCSYRHDEDQQGAYKLTHSQILDKIESAGDISEVHIVGGLYHEFDLKFYTRLFSLIRDKFPKIHRKGLTAEEIHYLSENSGKSYSEILKALIDSGLESMPGGGAEIFDPQIREIICPEKLTGEQWLEIHKEAHSQKITTNATMLYGHIETAEQRINHLLEIRNLQDQTNGFNAFIPLKYRLAENSLGITTESPLTDDLRTFAISRIYLDNIPHIKAYWPMIGFQNAILLTSFGADDLDGTIAQSTRIYSSTGNIKSNGITTQKLIDAIVAERKIAVERDSLYNQLN